MTTLTTILFQICLLALWGGLIYAAVKVPTFCFGYPNQFWELALLAPCWQGRYGCRAPCSCGDIDRSGYQRRTHTAHSTPSNSLWGYTPMN